MDRSVKVFFVFAIIVIGGIILLKGFRSPTDRAQPVDPPGGMVQKWEPDQNKATGVDRCAEHIELHSAASVARERGRSEAWVLANHKTTVWAKTTPNGKFPSVGEMRPGSRAVIIEVRGEDYKIRSPLDGSVGWVNEVQVARTLRQTTNTFRPCE